MENIRNTNTAISEPNERTLTLTPLENKLPVFQESDYGWEQAVRVLRKNSKIGFALAIAVTLLVTCAAFLMRDVFQPTARLEIAPPSSGIKTLHEIESNTESENLDYLETQAQLLRSDALAVSVIRGLHLDKNPAFISQKVITGKSETQYQIAPGGTIPGNGNVYLQDQLELATLSPSESEALEQFRKSLSVSTIRNTRLIEVGYAGHDPRLAQQITNALVANFIDQSYQHRYTSTMQASEWLSAQLNDLHRKMRDSTQAVSDYQQKHGLIEMDDHDIPLSQMMSEVNHRLSDAQANRIEQEATIRMIDTGQVDAVPILRDDQVYQNLMLQYAELRGQLAQAKAIYGDSNTNVKKLEDHLAELATQITSERTHMTARARASYSSSKDREKMMLAERDKLRAQMGSASSQLVGYHMLKNEAIANADLYNTLQTRLKEAGIYAGLRSTNIRVVDLAPNLQKATGPHRTLMIVGGMLMGSLFAVGFCFLKESFNNTLRTPDDVKSWTGLLTLALLPAMHSPESKSNSIGLNRQVDLTNSVSARERGPITVMKSLTAESEAMRDLRTALLLRGSSATPVVLVSSSMESEGKTTVAINLAVAFAQLGPTCLIDADLRQPQASRAFGLVSNPGLADVLAGNATLTTIVSETGISNLVIIPSGKSESSPADLLSSGKMGDLCAELSRNFMYVVIDTPPVIRFSDARFLTCHSDDVVLVARCGVTTRRAIQRSVELLKEVDAPLAGVVLNDIDLSSPDYHYYTYGYSRESEKRGKEYFQQHLDAGQPKDDSGDHAQGAHA